MDCWAGDLPAPKANKALLVINTYMEVIVYQVEHIYKSEGVSSQSFLLRVSKIFAITGIGLLLYSFGPSAFYFAKSGLKASVSAFKLTGSEVESLAAANQPAPVQYSPRFDPTLPKEAHLKIGSIGVDTILQEATYDNYEEALKRGVWRVSDFGAPVDNTKPTILAAHRFGYLAWTNTFRRKNSFFNLPKLKIGDTVEITWRQRKYVYEIYAEGKGEEITDYTADLILYTCEALTGPERIFRYARLLEV